VEKIYLNSLQEWVSSFDTVMTDCDGVLWIGGEAIPGSPEVINRYSTGQLRVKTLDTVLGSGTEGRPFPAHLRLLTGTAQVSLGLKQ
jgi:hypothetical protein